MNTIQFSIKKTPACLAGAKYRWSASGKNWRFPMGMKLQKGEVLAFLHS